jgi:nitroimidazol reductase NimA-like FMN-containing flavoprotein (pyridoxamine 5'-phosphate oxidase superfamily)
VFGAPLAGDDGLDASECYAKLTSRRMGRVVSIEGALPVVTPARYTVNGSDIYLATGPQSEQHTRLSGTVIALEVDDLDPRTGAGWVVTVTGIAEPCMHPSRWPLVVRLGLVAFDGGWPSVLRLPVDIVSGRRFPAI